MLGAPDSQSSKHGFNPEGARIMRPCYNQKHTLFPHASNSFSCLSGFCFPTWLPSPSRLDGPSRLSCSALLRAAIGRTGTGVPQPAIRSSNHDLQYLLCRSHKDIADQLSYPTLGMLSVHKPELLHLGLRQLENRSHSYSSCDQKSLWSKFLRRL